MAQRKEERNQEAETGERRIELLGNEVAAEAKENCSIYLPGMVPVERVNSLKGELEKLKEGHYCLMASLKLTQKELEGRRVELKEENVLIKSLRKAAKIRTVGEQEKR